MQSFVLGYAHVMLNMGFLSMSERDKKAPRTREE